MERKLLQPTFITIAEIQPGKHCYHVYGKVVEVKKTQRSKSSGESFPLVEGVIADNSGCANFRFPADQAGCVEQGAIIAIRNGMSSVVDEHIVLEVDRFGKLTPEHTNIATPNTKNNISATAWEKKPQR